MKFEKVKGGISLVGDCLKMPCRLCSNWSNGEHGCKYDDVVKTPVKSIVIKEIKVKK
jgi:hypothetical protein